MPRLVPVQLEYEINRTMYHKDPDPWRSLELWAQEWRAADTTSSTFSGHVQLYDRASLGLLLSCYTEDDLRLYLKLLEQNVSTGMYVDTSGGRMVRRRPLKFQFSSMPCYVAAVRLLVHCMQHVGQLDAARRHF